jgi:hypothetical protein
MLLSEYYKNSIYSQNGANYEVLEFGKNQRSRFTVKCIICSLVSTVTAASILSGRKPCICSGKFGTNSERKIERMLPILNKLGITLLDEVIGKSHDPIKLKCNTCDFHWEGTYSGVAFSQKGCRVCANNTRPSKEDLFNKVSEKGQKNNFTVNFVDYKIEKRVREIEFSLNCDFCGKDWITKIGSIRRNCACPHCAFSGFNPSLPAKLYILRVISEDNILQGYKYGITCDIERRLYEHKRDCRPLDINFELAYSWDYSTGLDAQLHERLIRKTFGSYFSQWELPSGFTETISITDLGELVDFQTNQYKDLANGRYY